MAQKLSTEMLRALRLAARTGRLESAGGGYWVSSEATHADRVNLVFAFGNAPCENVATTTVYALERRGLLERTQEHQQYYRDSRRITDAARCALGDG
jgi:hypothetical protein